MPIQLIKSAMTVSGGGATVLLLPPEEGAHAEIVAAEGGGRRYIIRLPSPVGQAALTAFYRTAVALAASRHCRSMAIPLMTEGVTNEQALRIASEVLGASLSEYEMKVRLSVGAQMSELERFSEVEAFLSEHYDGDPFDLMDGTPDAPPSPKSRLCASALPKRAAPCPTPKRIDAEFALPDEGPSGGALCSYTCEDDLDDIFAQMDKGFAETLFDYIDQKGLTDVEAYKRANVDKKTFSKLKCNPNYRPSKQTAVAFAIALHLNMEETCHLLSTVGMCLSRSDKFDVIIEYFIRSGQYRDIHDVNIALLRYDQRLLGNFS